MNGFSLWPGEVTELIDALGNVNCAPPLPPKQVGPTLTP